MSSGCLKVDEKINLVTASIEEIYFSNNYTFYATQELDKSKIYF